ncbi:MAG: hypothetical protein ACLFMP_00045 [Desulfonatronovibrionaceae bacterium]
MPPKTFILRLIMTGLFLSGLGLIYACAPKTKIDAVRPAEVSLPGVRTLAVLPFRGNCGEQVREGFYHQLDEVRHFSLIDMSQSNALDKVQWEQMNDPRHMPGFNQIQADAAITAYTASQIEDVQGTDQVQMEEGTGRYRKVKKENFFTGEEYFENEEIMRTVIKPVPYVLRSASLTASMKVIDLDSKRILATKKSLRSSKRNTGVSGKTALCFPRSNPKA